MSDTKTFRVVSLAQKGRFSEAMDVIAETQAMPAVVVPPDETMPLRIADVIDGLKERGEIDPRSSVTGRLPRRMDGRFAAPIHIPRDPEGRLPLTLRKFAEEAPIEDVVEAVVALSSTEGVEQPARPSSDDTLTHALPAVEKLTGKPSEKIDLHRTAARVQAAVWDQGVMVWYGDATKEFWVMTGSGLFPFPDVTSMYQGMGWQKL